MRRFAEWAVEQPARRVVIIAGNHDFCFQEGHADRQRALDCLHHYHIEYLQDSWARIDNVKFYGSPWQPWFHDWAFNLPRGIPLEKKWALIPDDTDVLITHGPPYHVKDRTAEGLNVGCEELRRRVFELSGHKGHLKAHVFGHIHEGYGVVPKSALTPFFVNASVCTRAYAATNEPIVIDV